MKNNQLVKVAILATAITLAACLAIVVSFTTPRQESDGLDDMRSAAQNLHEAEERVENARQAVEEAERNYESADRKVKEAEAEVEKVLQNP